MDEIYGVITELEPIMAVIETETEINVTIEGVGINGRTPQNGIDYNTPEEKQALFDELLALVKQDAEYTHDQIAASSSWVVNHNLNKFPSITIVDSGGSVVVGEETYVSKNQLILTFSAEFSGKAYLN